MPFPSFLGCYTTTLVMKQERFLYQPLTTTKDPWSPTPMFLLAVNRLSGNQTWCSNGKISSQSAAEGYWLGGSNRLPVEMMVSNYWVSASVAISQSFTYGNGYRIYIYMYIHIYIYIYTYRYISRSPSLEMG